MAEINVVVVAFPEEGTAYQALNVLKDLASADRIGVLSAAVVERGDAGALRVREGGDALLGEGVAEGSLVGMLVGILGGPVGMLLGMGTGALIGGAVDVNRASDADAMVSELARAIPPGRTALVAEIEEFAVEVIDGEMAKLGGTLVRRPATEVLTEFEASDDAAHAAEKEARKHLRDQRKAEHKEKYGERKAKLREKLKIS